MTLAKAPADELRVVIPYDRGSCELPLLAGASVVRPTAAPPLADPQTTIRAALRQPLGCPPLAELAAGATSIAISVCDGTRPQPRAQMLPPLLDILAEVAPDTRVTVLVATGTHRGNTPAELLDMLGADVLSRVDVINHDARDATQLVDLGVTHTGVPVAVNRHWVDADVRITTGFVEPHFFAGFSGGPKLVVPGLAGLETVLVLHDADRIASPRATWGRIVDNPVHEDIRACAALAPPTFSCDVLLDMQQRITHVYAGALHVMHPAACASARQHAMCEVDGEFDVVVTSNAGYPLDQNLYQAVKGLAAAERIVRPGGTIVLAAGCADGLPEHGLFGELLAAASSIEELTTLTDPGHPTRPDQWQAQILARVLSRARVLAYADGLTAQQLASAFITKIDDLAEGIAQAGREAGPDARICYLPGGPMTIPYVATEDSHDR